MVGLSLSMAPKVLFEISVLGYAANGPAYRTGVFRMVDQWARQLAGRNEIDLTFTSLLDPKTSLRAERFWSRSASLSQREFLPRSTLRMALQPVDQVYLELAEDGEASLPKRVVRRALSETLSVWEKIASLPA